ncbi:MAG: 1,4-alpha-glucan branching protein GlgB [Dehalococcoidia bacterium]|nr:1,4-alpha-glucan branching protein GlgB [Dehalococcoidia bacterium]
MKSLGEMDRWLFNEGRHSALYEVLGAHVEEDATHFGVWAPTARAVQVVGDFDRWGAGGHYLHPSEAGVWTGTVNGARVGHRYKFRLFDAAGHPLPDKLDPMAFATELPPATGGVIANLEHAWGDDRWMAGRRERNALDAPISIYEVHLGSWRAPADYRGQAEPLARHARNLGFTHVELLPVMEHPFYGSWGYQTTGYFAPTARYGSPEDFMYLVDTLHQHGIGVILDWTPAHFPDDPHGLGLFDGTHLYEHADPRRGRHPDWDTLIFNYDRHEVRSFLLSSACFWLDRYHVDGLRVDAVASMLYLDYSRREGEWLPNESGGRENLGAIRFLRELNETVYRRFPDVQTYAEESTAWPMVSRPTSVGGLGFGLKWDMGWMHDTLAYFERDPIHRAHHHRELTFRSIYAGTENFVLPLSHDEVVHGKRSLLGKMPGDEWQRFAELRTLLGYQFGTPGKKLLFMGTELAPGEEWSHEEVLDWALLEDDARAGVARWLTALNEVYGARAALHASDCGPEGFAWVVSDDAAQSILAFARSAEDADAVLVIANLTPVVRDGYRLGVPVPGEWVEMLNSDAIEFGGSGVDAGGPLRTEDIASHGRAQSLVLRLPPLAVVFLAPAR